MEPHRPRARRRAPDLLEPRVRRGTVRVAPDVAARLRAGHPLVFREALGARPLRENAGEMIEVVDADGSFVARGLYDPEGVVALRVVTRDPHEIIDGTALRNRVEAARRLRAQHLTADTDAYRVIHGEGDAVPGITVDRYGDHLVAHLYTAAAEPLRDWLYDALEAAFRPKAIYEQKRYKPQSGEGVRAPATLARGLVAPVEIEVREGGLKFGIDVTAPLGTGLFPDLREGRRAVGERAKGRRVLNLFSYTGAFSVWAARGGASKVTSVDLAQKALRARAAQPAAQRLRGIGARADRRRRVQGAGEDVGTEHEVRSDRARSAVIRAGQGARVLGAEGLPRAGRGGALGRRAGCASRVRVEYSQAVVG